MKYINKCNRNTRDYNTMKNLKLYIYEYKNHALVGDIMHIILLSLLKLMF